MKKRDVQIFYDKKHIRWRYSRRTMVIAASFLLAVFSVAIGSVIVRPSLPQINLPQPTMKYRGVPNVPKQTQVATIATTAQNAQSFVPVAANASIESSNNIGRRMIGFYVNWDDNSMTSLKSNISHLDELVPEWYHLSDTPGDIVVDDQNRQDETMTFIKSTRPSLPISPIINNYNQTTQDWDEAQLSNLLSNANNRTELIQKLKNTVEQNSFSGISIDFENVPDVQQKNLILFIQELYGVFHPLGLEVSQNVPLDDDSYDLKTLSNYADFLILMAYDQYSIDSTLAGPVASQSWFVNTLNKDLKLIPAEKTVVAVGGYGYDWIDGKQSGGELSFQDAIRTAKESQAGISLDNKSLNPTYDYYDDNNILHHVWFLDAVTVFNEMLSANRLGNIKGYALWRIGSEDPALWNVFDGKSVLNAETAKLIENMQYGYDVTYDGSGEILRATGVPKIGKRSITFDDKSGFITDENVIDFPSSYEITRWGGNDNKKLAITFDDGPSSDFTPKILDVLKKYNVPATFFVIGSNANSNQSILKRIVDQGGELGNHTYTHPNISAISSQQFRLELDATERLFEGIVGRKSLLFRPPYSEDIEPSTPDQVVPLIQTNAMGYYTVGMNIDPNDWSKPGVNEIVNRVVTSAEQGEGSVILLHDSGGDRQQTVDALPLIIQKLQSQGFQFVIVSDLMGLNRDDIMPKISSGEQFLARINGTAFVTVSMFNNFIYDMFIIGIALGLMRFIFIGSLAIFQWLHSRRGAFKKYSPRYKPCVYVIVPAYNEEKVIRKTIESILRSTYQDFHIVIVDDGSIDNTYEIAQSAFGDDSRIAVYTKENGGKADALNYGIERSLGEIIVTLDADTLFRHDTIEKLVRRFVDRRIGAVAGNAKVGNRVNILTRWQALEYITSQNMDRRAFEIINCVTVVPGAVGAWRKSVLIEAGGFSKSTLAEDADLTFSILKNGHRVAYDDEAIGLTEAPDTVKNFIKQRFRWMYGTLQTVWKHRSVFARPRYRALGFFAIPNVAVFQIFFPLISPLMDLMLIVTVIWTFLQKQSHQVDFSSTQTFKQVLLFYVLFTVIDLLTGVIPYLLERKEDWSLLLWLPLQRFFYRQLIYYVAIKSIVTAIRGKIVGWSKFERKATVVGEAVE